MGFLFRSRNFRLGSTLRASRGTDLPGKHHIRVEMRRGDREELDGRPSSDEPEPVVVEGETLQVVEPQKGGGRDGGESHPSQYQTMEVG